MMSRANGSDHNLLPLFKIDRARNASTKGGVSISQRLPFIYFEVS